jgi:hypothetical protein
MLTRFSSLVLFLCSTSFAAAARAETPPLLATAFEQWAAGREDLAFTQQTRTFRSDGAVREERVERYDPSLPDSRRWRLLEIDGRAATDAQRQKWGTWKNGKARKKVSKSLAEYLDLEHATPMNESPKYAHFEVGLRPEVARLIAVEKVSVVVTIDKATGTISHIAANLREPIRVLLGLAKITDLDLDVRIAPGDDDAPLKSGEVKTGSTVRVMMSKLGDPLEYRWSDFKRVTTYGGPKEAGAVETARPP